MPISTTHYRRCRTCGKVFPVVIGDCIGSYEFLMLLHPVCGECKEKEVEEKLKKLFKGGSP